MLKTDRLRTLFSEKKQYLDYFFDHLNYEAVEQVFAAINGCKGTVLFTGVGKSGIIAKKIATTMVSTGTRSLYVSPLNALHGDLGVVAPGDVCVILSKSGESDELLNLIPFLRNKGARPIAIVSNLESRLAKAAELAVELPLERELCPFGLAPTTSATLQLIFGDVLAVALMHERGFSLDDYALNHPAGSIGKRITLKVSDLMLTGDALPMCGPKDTLGSRLQELSDKRCGCLVVLDEHSKLLGIFTDGDLRRALQSRGSDLVDAKIEDLMTTGCRSIAEKALAWDAMKLMEADQSRPIMVLPTVDGDERVVGLIKLHDILQSGL